MGAVLKFPIPSRGRYSCREQVSNEPATVRGRALLAFTRSNSRTDINPARKVIVRMRFQIPSIPPPDGPLAGEAGAYCCRFTGPFLGKGHSRVLNFCRFLTGWSLPRVQPAKQPRGSFSNSLQFLCSLLGFHTEQLSMEPEACRTQSKGIRNP